jgi:predicted enzyme related to lactoylglutathione lyase
MLQEYFCIPSQSREISMNTRPKPSAVIFAKNIAKLAHFYSAVVGMTEVLCDKDHIVLDAECFQLVVHGIPQPIAEQIQISEPPQVREDMPIKICLPVQSIEQARLRATELGGNVGTKAKEWDARGFRACDGHDPEGNVFQVRESAA